MANWTACTEAHVERIRALARQGRNVAEIAAALGLTARTIHGLAHQMRREGEVISFHPPSKWRVALGEARALAEAGLSRREIAARMGVSFSYIKNLCEAAEEQGAPFPRSRSAIDEETTAEETVAPTAAACAAHLEDLRRFHSKREPRSF